MRESKMKVKKKSHKTADPTWDTVTYGSPKSPFDIEWLKIYNPMEGKDQIIFIYTSKISGKICKYKTLF